MCLFGWPGHLWRMRGIRQSGMELNKYRPAIFALSSLISGALFVHWRRARLASKMLKSVGTNVKMLFDVDSIYVRQNKRSVGRETAAEIIGDAVYVTVGGERYHCHFVASLFLENIRAEVPAIVFISSK